MARVALELERPAGHWQLVAVESTVHGVDLAVEPDPEVEADVCAAFDRFRTAYAAPLPPSAPSNRDDLVRFVLEAMREADRAEVAVLNSGALRPVAAEVLARRPLPREAVLRLLSFDQELATTTLTGSRLLALAEESARRVDGVGAPRRDSLYLLGMEPRVDHPGTPEAHVTDATVNGRPLWSEDTYTVVTTRYLAAGGDDYTVLAGADSAPLRRSDGQGLELSEDMVLPRLATADVPFPDLSRQPLWRWRTDRLGLLFDGVRADRDPAYASSSDSRARAEDSTSFLAEARLRLDREVFAWRWENRLRARFGLPTATGAETREVDDHLVLDSSAVFIRAPFLGGSPYAAVTVDTELRPGRETDGTVLPRQLEESVSAGVTWSARLWPRLRLGLVGPHYFHSHRRDQVGTSAELSFLLASQARRLGVDASLLLERLLDSETSTARSDLDLRVLIPIRGGLALTPGLDLYLLDDSTRLGIARYTRLSPGPTWTRQGKSQRW